MMITDLIPCEVIKWRGEGIWNIVEMMTKELPSDKCDDWINPTLINSVSLKKKLVQTKPFILAYLNKMLLK